MVDAAQAAGTGGGVGVVGLGRNFNEGFHVQKDGADGCARIPPRPVVQPEQRLVGTRGAARPGRIAGPGEVPVAQRQAGKDMAQQPVERRLEACREGGGGDLVPELARGRPTPARNRKIATVLAQDVDRTVWTLPEGARRLRFAVNVLGNPVFRPKVGRAIGIISPFVSPDALKQLTKGLEPSECWLLSRAEELVKVSPDVLARFGQVMVLDDLAETEDGDDSEAACVVFGLHAKVFVTERYPRPESTTDLTVGSGNATAAALLNGRNVEVFATLSGPSRRLGWVVDHIAPERLGRFLRPWQPPTTTPAPDPALAAEERLEDMCKTLAAADLTLRCTPAEDRRVGLTLTAKEIIAMPETIRAELWPLTLGPNHSVPVTALGRSGLHLGQFALADVTRWLGLRLSDIETGLEMVFTLGTTLKDLPEERTAEILRSIIENREAFLHYLRLLLGDPQAAGQIILHGGKGGFLGFAGFDLLHQWPKHLTALARLMGLGYIFPNPWGSYADRSLIRQYRVLCHGCPPVPR